ncbi:DEAD-domain-containing protein [Melanogaster broomeanus]|nr:DEAD-domain-containing protein [Melanogaster broomeanus]
MSHSTAFAGLWSSLPTSLTPWILDVIQSLGHTHMTPVQASTIPLFMQHKDVVVEAERLIRRESKLRRNEIGALVISPTRELATQIHSIFTLFLSAQPCPPSPEEPGRPISTPQPMYPPPLLLVSSDQSSPAQDIQRFLETGADIVIGTPGRVEEFLIGRGKTVVSVKDLEVLVLDEADRLLDLGFQNALARIITHLPKQRRTGLFSATMTDADALSELVRVGLRNPARVVVKVQSKKSRKQNSEGKQEKGELIEERRIPAGLQNFYISLRASHFIVYFATCACVDYFYRLLPSKYKLFSLHGHLPPAARTRALSAFSSTLSSSIAPSILLATDVAARGLDIPHVEVVIQFDPPSDPKAFSHRCGRTARAGRSGRAYVFLAGRETEYVDFLAVRKIPIRRHPYIRVDGALATEVLSEPESEDPVVNRALSDKVRPLRCIDTPQICSIGCHLQGAKGFVSFVRAYSKHEASYIFRISDLDLIGVAKSFGLLRLPRMPELTDADKTGWSDAQVDWDTYKYADKAQEAKRIQERPKKEASRDTAETRAAKRKRNTSWSEQVENKVQKEKRKLKKERKRQWLKAQTATAGAGEAKTQNPEEGDDEKDDWDELAREERVAKKVRKGTVTQTDFDAEFADL